MDILKDWKRLLLHVALPVVVALLSIFALSPFFSDPNTYAWALDYLGDKQTYVTGLMAGSTAAALATTTFAAISAKLADLAMGFALVLGAIILEKFLLVIIAKAVFTLVIPIICALHIADQFIPQEAIGQIVRKLAIFSIAIMLVIPATVLVSKTIDETYTSLLTVTAEASSTEAAGEAVPAEEQGNWWEDPLKSLQGVADAAGSQLAALQEQAQTVLNDFVTTLAVQIVTTCIMPILILVFFLWLIKLILGVDVPMPKARQLHPGAIRKKAVSVVNNEDSADTKKLEN